MPLKLMGIVMGSLTVCIVSSFTFLFVVLANVKNDQWVYGKEFAKYANRDTGGISIFGIVVVFPRWCPCLRGRKGKIVLDQDRAKLARDKVKETKAKKLEKRLEKIQKTSAKAAGGGDYKKMESSGAPNCMEGGDHYRMWLLIISADNLRSPNWGGKSDPVVVANLKGKEEESRIVTAVCPNTLTPVWNHQAELKDYALGDEIQVIIYDEDTLGSLPEDGDFLGKVVLGKEWFHPDGMAPTDIPLTESNRGDVNDGLFASVRIKVISVRKGFAEPEPPPKIDFDAMAVANAEALRKKAKAQRKEKRTQKQKDKKGANALGDDGETNPQLGAREELNQLERQVSGNSEGYRMDSKV